MGWPKCHNQINSRAVSSYLCIVGQTLAAGKRIYAQAGQLDFSTVL